MKSREEYQASIFAKRDALLKKRKKHISQAVTGIGAVVLITVSAVAIPRFSEKLPQTSEVTEQQSTTAVCEEYVSQQHSDYDYIHEAYSVKTNAGTLPEITDNAAEAVPEKATENPTLAVIYPVTKKHPNIRTTDVYSEEAVDEMITEPATNDNIQPESSDELYVGTMHSHKEIVDAAFSHLSVIQKARCTNKDNPHVMPVTSSSWSVYMVTFSTDSEESYRVILRQNDLEFVETVILSEKEIQKETEPVTFMDGYKGESQ